MSWWDHEEGGVLELDELELELRVVTGITVAWWVHSQSGAFLGFAAVGIA